MNRTGLCLLVLIGFPTAAAGEPLGRLIYTPEERARMEAQRSSGKEAARDAPSEHSKNVPARATATGIVERSDGQRILWLDGARLRPGSLPESLPESLQELLRDAARWRDRVGTDRVGRDRVGRGLNAGPRSGVPAP
ncbi:MAG: hypothetical protein IT532_04085 [Burkholderiales bacterium]|nr:hypothetical protein [Burkholderiales bacterium]